MAFSPRNDPGLIIRLPDGSEWKAYEGKLGEHYYAWSPDGRYLAFRAERTPEEIPRFFSLQVVDMKSRTVEKVTDYLPGLGRPGWRVADGTLEVFAVSATGLIRRAFPTDELPQGPSWMVYERDGDIWSESEGRSPVQISRGGGYAPVMAPDGERFLYCWGDGIFLADVHDSPALERTAIAAGVSPCWSPDGRFLAFCRVVDLGHEDQGLQSDIWILDASKPGAAPRQVTFTPEEIEFEVTWPEPDRIYFAVRNDGSIKSARISI